MDEEELVESRGGGCRWKVVELVNAGLERKEEDGSEERGVVGLLVNREELLEQVGYLSL